MRPWKLSLTLYKAAVDRHPSDYEQCKIALQNILRLLYAALHGHAAERGTQPAGDTRHRHPRTRYKTDSMRLSPLGALGYLELHSVVSNYIIFVAPGKQHATHRKAYSARRAGQDHHTHHAEMDEGEAWMAYLNPGIMRLLGVLAYNQGLVKGLNMPQALLNLVCKNHQRQNKIAGKLTLEELDAYYQAPHHSEPQDPYQPCLSLVLTEDQTASLSVEQSDKACRNPMVGSPLPSAQ